MTESFLTLSFPDNIIFLEKLIFILYPISLPTIKGMVYFKWKLTLSKTTEYLSISWTTQRRLSTCLELFLARSNLFKLAMACYWLFQFLQVTKSQNFLTYRFTINQLLQRNASVVISRTAFLNYKAGQVVLQSRAVNIK